MIYTDKSCTEFIADVASKAPVPGGGSVAALVGALGAALGNMDASLTVGKKKYADVEEEMQEMILEIRHCQKCTAYIPRPRRRSASTRFRWRKHCMMPV